MTKGIRGTVGEERRSLTGPVATEEGMRSLAQAIHDALHGAETIPTVRAERDDTPHTVRFEADDDGAITATAVERREAEAPGRTITVEMPSWDDTTPREHAPGGSERVPWIREWLHWLAEQGKP